jgi:glycosyltransferase involved in cell wall biosynthesis
LRGAPRHDLAVATLRRIGLNALFLVPGETGGMETYARRLVPALAAAAPELEFVAFVGREALERAGPELFGAGVPSVVVGSTANRLRRVAVEQVALPRLARREGIDLLHSLGTTAPALPGCVSVVTIHDVIYATHPEAHTAAMRSGMRILVPLAARRADRIITPSEAAKRDVVARLGVPADRVDAIHSAGGLPPGRPTPEEELRRRYWLDEAPIVLSVSARRPHKNLVRLLEAFARVRSEPRPLLVLPGYRTAFEHEVTAAIERLGLGDRVRMLGWVPDPDLEGLYAAAACFVFPSLAEGFGQPVLEAMERGVPVTSSNTSALPEVGGNAVLYFDPLDIAAIADAVERLLVDRAFAERLAVAGRLRAAEFSWERTARETIEAYQRALAEHSRRRAAT